MFSPVLRGIFWLANLALASLLVMSVRAEPPGEVPDGAAVKGTVVDESGALVPGAMIRLTDQDSHTSLTTETDGIGNFSLEGLAPATCTLEVHYPAMKRFVQTNLKLAAGRRFDLEVTLEFCKPSYLGQTESGFSMQVERAFSSVIEEELMNTAELIPCPEGNWTNEQGDGVRLPTCVDRHAVDYFVDLFERYKKGKFPATGDTPIHAEAYYVATVEFHREKKQWVVRLRLEYSHYCGNVCAYTFWRTRVITFDEAKNVIEVVNSDDCDAGWVS